MIFSNMEESLNKKKVEIYEEKKNNVYNAWDKRPVNSDGRFEFTCSNFAKIVSYRNEEEVKKCLLEIWILLERFNKRVFIKKTLI